ncbi:NAD(P)-dependent oxidoreductase [Dactylosporangium maewongense]|uniref:NAD(P)-dependent oxidoreductase n=1 Tax=Dactylosporangium maewongense TaxID=634393 RepID=A0ABN2D1D1_9ACTN
MSTHATDNRTRVAVLGIGIMGQPIAANLAQAGFAVSAWNRTPGKAEPLADHGVLVAASAAEAVADADVVLTILTDADAVLSAMGAALPSMPEGAVWIQASTVGERVDDLVAFADSHALRFVDAPVQGTRKPAEDGTLLVICAADPLLRPVVQPVFDAIGSRTLWVAETSSQGTASRLKIATHTYVAGLTHAVGEALAMATALGVAPQLVVDAMAGGPLDCGFMRGKASVIIDNDYAASFTVDNSIKDAHIVLRAAERHGVVVDCTRAGLSRYERLSAAGYGDSDMAATYLASFVGEDGSVLSPIPEATAPYVHATS